MAVVEIDYGSSFQLGGTRNLQAEKLNFRNQITPLTLILRHKNGSNWVSIVMHFIVEGQKVALRDIPFCMLFVENYLDQRGIQYNSILRVR